MKRRMKHDRGDAGKKKSMTGKEFFTQKAKKPEPDDRPRTPIRPASVNRNTAQAKRVSRLKGVVL